MKQAFRWITILAFGGVAFIVLEFSLRYLFGAPAPLNILFALFFALCWLVVTIKVGNWLARLIGLDSPLKKGQHWWYERHG